VTYEHSLQTLDSKVPKSFPSVQYSGEDVSNFNAITAFWSISKWTLACLSQSHFNNCPNWLQRNVNISLRIRKFSIHWLSLNVCFTISFHQIR